MLKCSAAAFLEVFLLVKQKRKGNKVKIKQTALCLNVVRNSLNIKCLFVELLKIYITLVYAANCTIAFVKLLN